MKLMLIGKIWSVGYKFMASGRRRGTMKPMLYLERTNSVIRRRVANPMRELLEHPGRNRGAKASDEGETMGWLAAATGASIPLLPNQGGMCSVLARDTTLAGFGAPRVRR